MQDTASNSNGIKSAMSYFAMDYNAASADISELVKVTEKSWNSRESGTIWKIGDDIADH